jgi:hypothetical protein
VLVMSCKQQAFIRLRLLPLNSGVRPPTNMRTFVSIILLTSLLLACGLAPRKVSPDSEELRPFYKAMAASPRLSLGFTPIEPSSDIRIEGHPRSNYDAMLHIYGKTSRTIAFKKVANEYIWIGEQEIYTGPRRYSTADGDSNEEVVVDYETVPLAGFPLSKLAVTYHGPDVALSRNLNRTLPEVQPMISKWVQEKK